jgi:hypothetical protein
MPPNLKKRRRTTARCVVLGAVGIDLIPETYHSFLDS